MAQMGSIVKGVLDLMCVTIYMVSSLEVFIHAWLLLAPHGLCLKSSWWAFERSGSGHAHRKSWNHSTWGSIAWRKKKMEKLSMSVQFCPPTDQTPNDTVPKSFHARCRQSFADFRWRHWRGSLACTSMIQCGRYVLLKITWSGDSDGDGWMG